MALEQLINSGHTTLNGAITSSATSIIVTSGSVFPSIGNFHLTIDDEILLCTARSTNTLTVVRGQEGTTAINHDSLSSVRLLLTAGSLKQWFADNFIQDTYANQPANTNDGRLFFATDNNYLQRDNGSTWDTFGLYYRFITPPSIGWTQINAIASVLTHRGYLQFDTTPTPSTSVHVGQRAEPSIPYTITCFLNFDAVGKDGLDLGLCWREGSSGKLVTIGWRIASGICKFAVSKWDSISAYNSEYKSVLAYNLPSSIGGMWVRISRDSTNRKVYLSGDGWNWCLFHSVSASDFCTPTSVGLFINDTDAGLTQNAYLYLFSWKEE